ncbi:MAG TPA: type I 3-dehydroquinate dehydratase [Chloroflexota bacterium]
MRQALAGLPRIRAEAHCVELRLDLFEEPFDLRALLAERGDLPVVVTLRPPEQGGRSLLPPAERLAVLREAAEQGAEYVDLEYDVASPAAIAELRAAGTRVIVSRHDFSAMPRLTDWWGELSNLGADVVKVVGTARHVCDALEVTRTFRAATQPTIAIAMGAPGLLTRVLALREEHCLLTYAALDAGGGTAPGQITAREMREAYHADRLGPATRVYGLLGPHDEAERLTEYNAWFAADGIAGVAVPLHVESDAAAVVAAYRELPVSGWHVHGAALQTDVLARLDHLSPAATRQAKANAITRRADGTLEGHWVESPRQQYELWRAADG